MGRTSSRPQPRPQVQATPLEVVKTDGCSQATPSAMNISSFNPGASSGSSRNLYHEVWRKIASSMMDISLFLSNSNQLANVIRKPSDVPWDAAEIVSLVLICLSILLQIVVGVIMILSRRVSLPRDSARTENDRGTSICVFLIFIMNVMILCINNEATHYSCAITHNSTDSPHSSPVLLAEHPASQFGWKLR